MLLCVLVFLKHCSRPRLWPLLQRPLLSPPPVSGRDPLPSVGTPSCGAAKRALFTLLLLWLPVAASAQTQQSSCPAEVIMTDSGTQFGSVNFSFDNRRLVFIKNGFLHSVPSSGGPFTVLNPDKADLTFASVRRFTPDSRRVVFLTTSGQDLPDDIGIFSVPIDGSEPPVKLLDSPPPGIIFQDLRITNDGSRLVTIDDADTQFQRELYSVPTAGGPAVKLNAPLRTPDTDITQFLLTPDQRSVVYSTSDDRDSLFIAPIDGSAPAQAIPGFEDLEIELFNVGKDGATLLARIRTDLFEGDLYKLPITGGTPVQLTDGGSAEAFTVERDGRIFYLVDINFDNDLFTVAPGSNTPVRLNPELPPFRSVFNYFIFDDFIVYEADQEVGGRDELYRVPRDGSAAPVKISQPLSGDQTVIQARAQAPDTRIVYTVRDLDPAAITWEIFSVDAATNDPPIQISGTQALDEDAREVLRLTNNPAKVYFYITRPGSATGWYTVGVDGSDLLRVYGPPRADPTDALDDDLPEPLPPGFIQQDFTMNGDGSRIAHQIRDTNTNQVSLLLSSALPGCDLDSPYYTVAGTVSGVTAPGLVLRHNSSENITVNADGAFAFTTNISDSTAYIVDIVAEPPGQDCSVSNGSGLIGGGNINDVVVSCQTSAASAPGGAASATAIPSSTLFSLLTLTALLALLGSRRVAGRAGRDSVGG